MKTPESIRRDLADLSADGANTARSADEIRRAAEDRHQTVLDRLDALRPTTATDDSAAAEYQTLVAERGQLETVLGHGRV
jgi:hypothetical protein